MKFAKKLQKLKKKKKKSIEFEKKDE